MDNRIFVIDDEQDFLDSVRRGLITSGFSNVGMENDPRKAVSLFLEGESPDVALIDITMPGMNGIKLLEWIKSTKPNTECIMVTAANEARIAVDCLKKGAYDYLTKPVSREDLVQAVNRAIERKRLLDILVLGKKKSRPKLMNEEAFGAIITRSTRMIKVHKEAELHARSDVSVLITGESGSGKELLAQAIHNSSRRAAFRYTPVNMASLTGTLFNAEFFGHTKGAFTGAERDREGYLEHSHRGTLFMDEIGNLPYDLQGSLLRVLQEGEYLKLGSNKPQKADVRFIIATNANLEQMLEKGTFRKDLYYRLKGAWLHLPPLRDRKEDIPLLVNRFLREFRGHDAPNGIEEEALSVLMEHNYPGNVRELRSILQSAVNLAQDRPISIHFLPGNIRKRKKGSRHRVPETTGPITPLWEVEKAYILRVYEQAGRNKAQASDLLGIGLNTLRRKLKLYGEE